MTRRQPLRDFGKEPPKSRESRCKGPGNYSATLSVSDNKNADHEWVPRVRFCFPLSPRMKYNQDQKIPLDFKKVTKPGTESIKRKTKVLWSVKLYQAY